MTFTINSMNCSNGKTGSMRFWFLLIASGILCASVGLWAAPKTKKVTSEYVYQIPENVTHDQARETALMRARAQAIADEFGTFVTQSTSVMVENKNGDSNVDFMSLGGSELKGEWIEDSEPPVFEYVTDGTSLAIKVKIKGVIREVEGTRVPISVKILRNDVSERAESGTFVSEDDLFIRFSSPVAGYLAIYFMDNEKNVYCLLPYQSQDGGVFEVKANKNYLLFHPDYADGVDKAEVDRFIVDTELPSEYNRIMAIFSPNKFYKGADTKSAPDYPRMLSFDKFQQWLTNLRKKDPDLTISEHSILITAKE